MGTLQRVRARSAQELQPLLRQISKTERAILGALEETYIMSAIKEKLSTRARDTYACRPQTNVRPPHTTIHWNVMTGKDFKNCKTCIPPYKVRVGKHITLTICGDSLLLLPVRMSCTAVCILVYLTNLEEATCGAF